MEGTTNPNNQPYMQYQQHPNQQVPQNQGQNAWIPLEPLNNGGSYNSQVRNQNMSQPLLNPQQHPGVLGSQDNNYNARPNMQPFDTGFAQDSNPSAYRNLEMEYEKFNHFSVVNVLLGVLSIIMTLGTIFFTIFMSFDDYNYNGQDNRDNHGGYGNRGHVEQNNQTKNGTDSDSTQYDYYHDGGEYGDDFRRFESQAKAAICFIAIVSCILNCVLYYYGKYAYDNKKLNYFKVLFVIYCVLFAFAFISTSLINGIAFGYLGFCAYKLRLILEQMENIQNVRH